VFISHGKLDEEKGKPSVWCISAEGNDDFALEKFYSNENISICEFMQLLGEDEVNYKSFKALSGEDHLENVNLELSL